MERATHLAERAACAQIYSSKGLNKRTNSLGFTDYLESFEMGVAVYGVSMGLFKKSNVLYTY